MSTQLKEEGARVKAAVLEQWGSLIGCAEAMGESRHRLYDTVAGRPQPAEFLTKLAQYCNQPADAFSGLRRPDLAPEEARRREQLNANLALARAASRPSEEERQRREARTREFGTMINNRRGELGLSNADIARLTDVSAAQVYCWMRGTARPMPERLPALARALRLDPHVMADQLELPRDRRPFGPAVPSPAGPPPPTPVEPRPGTPTAGGPRAEVEQAGEEEVELQQGDPGLHGQEALRARFSRQLKGWQRDSRVSRLQIATALSVSPTQVQKWLGGRALPSLGRLPALAQILGVHLRNMAQAVGMTEQELIDASHVQTRHYTPTPETIAAPLAGDAPSATDAAVLVGSLATAPRETASPGPPRVAREAHLSTIELPAGLLTLLLKAGVRSVGDLLALTPSALEAIPHVDRGGVKRVREVLAFYDLSLAPEPPAVEVLPRELFQTVETPRAAPPEPREAAAPPAGIREPDPLAPEPTGPQRIAVARGEAPQEPVAAGPADYTTSPLWKQAHQLAQLVLVALDRMQEDGPLRHALWHAVIDVPRHLALATRARQTVEMTRALHRAAECALSAEYYLRLAEDMRLLPQGVGALALNQLAALAAAIGELEPETTP